MEDTEPIIASGFKEILINPEVFFNTIDNQSVCNT